MFGSRVNATPVPELFPVLPKTIAWTLTAVPFSPVIRSIRRYSTALLPIQLLKTAMMARQSWSFGSWGNGALTCFSYTAL